MKLVSKRGKKKKLTCDFPYSSGHAPPLPLPHLTCKKLHSHFTPPPECLFTLSFSCIRQTCNWDTFKQLSAAGKILPVWQLLHKTPTLSTSLSCLQLAVLHLKDQILTSNFVSVVLTIVGESPLESFFFWSPCFNWFHFNLYSPKLLPLCKKGNFLGFY